MNKILFTIALVSLLLAGCASQPEDTSPANEEIARAFMNALSKGDTVTSIGMLAEECVFSIGLSEEQTVGKEKVAILLGRAAEWHEKYSVTSPFGVKGEKVIFTALITSDELQIIGVDSVTAEFEIVIRDNKVVLTKIPAMPRPRYVGVG